MDDGFTWVKGDDGYVFYDRKREMYIDTEGNGYEWKSAPTVTWNEDSVEYAIRSIVETFVDAGKDWDIFNGDVHVIYTKVYRNASDSSFKLVPDFTMDIIDAAEWYFNI